jgi:hypothetical protein
MADLPLQIGVKFRIQPSFNHDFGVATNDFDESPE